MEFGIEMLSAILAQNAAEITFPTLQQNAKESVEMECYKALKQIREIINDENWTMWNALAGLKK